MQDLEKFLSTPSARRATDVPLRAAAHSSISIHALREEGDLKHRTILQTQTDFYPRPPRGGRPGWRPRPPSHCNFYPRPPRGGRHGGLSGIFQVGISIHALREEGDLVALRPDPLDGRFLSTPSARRATSARFGCSVGKQFLSTPSARRATFRDGRPDLLRCISIHALREEGDKGSLTKAFSGWYFYPRPPRGGRPATKSRPATTRYFYPRPPRGGRHIRHWCCRFWERFLSTPSARRATCRPAWRASNRTISIHALREEGDTASIPSRPRTMNFYPRPPRGGRRKGSGGAVRRRYFYPRPPRGGRRGSGISAPTPDNFYPRPPRGGRRRAGVFLGVQQGISIHALREEGDAKISVLVYVPAISIHALREEGDLLPSMAARAWAISIHALREEGDRHRAAPGGGAYHFYPRPPRGGRPDVLTD